MLGWVIRRFNDVLEGHGQAKKPIRSGDGAGREARAIRIERREGTDVLLAFIDGFQREFEHRRRGEIPGFDGLGEVERAHHGLVPSSLEITKRVARWAKGAAMSAAR